MLLAPWFRLAWLAAAIAATACGASPRENVPAPSEADSRVARGRYLVEHVLVCVECHSEKDKSRYASPIVGLPGAGGACFGAEAGLPGELCAMNLTPDPETGLGGWTDAEILRAVREGLGRDGSVVFPMKPIRGYRHLSEEDGSAMLAHLRSLPPVVNEVPDSVIHLPPEVLTHLNPPPLEGPVSGPDEDDPVDRGRYLARIAGCESCHTPVDARQQPIDGMAYAGGREFQTRNGVVRSSNLTLHETGWGGRDADNFVGLFRSFEDVSAHGPSRARETRATRSTRRSTSIPTASWWTSPPTAGPAPRRIDDDAWEGSMSETETGKTREFVVGGVASDRPFRIRRLGHVGLYVADMEAALRFYRGLLGFAISDPLDLGENIAEPEVRRRVGTTVVYFMRHGTDHHSSALRPGVDRSALAIDPDGHALELYFQMEQVGWYGRPRPAALRHPVDGDAWPETIDADELEDSSEPFLGPLG